MDDVATAAQGVEIAAPSRALVRRPLLRGWSHAVAAVPAGLGAAALVAHAHGDHLKQLSLGVYGAGLALLFAVSALYHCRVWSPVLAAWLRRVDHANVFILIASTYTPVAVTVLSGWGRLVALGTVWTTAAAGMALVLVSERLPRLARTALYVGAGWASVLLMPATFARVGWDGLAYLATGGVLYSLGALAYAAQRPRLWPRVFGYHEVFHLLVLVASAAFFAFMAREVAPLPRT